MGGSYPAKRKASVILAYFLIYVVWGSTYYFIGVALRDIPTFLLGALRFSVAGILLLAICAWRGEKVLHPQLIRRSAVSGIVLLFVDMAVIMLAQRYVSSSLVAIVASSTGIWIMLLDVPMWRKNFRNFRMVAGMLIGFSGVGMLYIEQLFLDTALSMHNEYGIIILIGGCISWAFGTLYTKSLFRSRRARCFCRGGLADDFRQHDVLDLLVCVRRLFSAGLCFRAGILLVFSGLSDCIRLPVCLYGIRMVAESPTGLRSGYTCLRQSGGGRSYRHLSGTRTRDGPATGWTNHYRGLRSVGRMACQT